MEIGVAKRHITPEPGIILADNGGKQSVRPPEAIPTMVQTAIGLCGDLKEASPSPHPPIAP